jgi:hypothetical protein
LVFAFTISYLVSAWTEPAVTPPGGNVDTPINVGNIGQIKAGGLILNTGGATNGLIVQSGNVGIGNPSPELWTKLDITNIRVQAGKTYVNLGFFGWEASYMLIVPHKTACWACLFRPAESEKIEKLKREMERALTH